MQQDILDSIPTPKINRRALLPLWIKIFIWIFIAFGVLAPIAFILGLAGFTFSLSMYGLETNQPISLIGILVISIFLLKGVTAYGLWTEKDWAITFGQIDAVIGLAICTLVMFGVQLPGGVEVRTNFRVEILLLIPYLVKLQRLRKIW
jgi:hypothetical protein